MNPANTWQPKKPQAPGGFPVSATIFAGDQKMWSRSADGIDLLKLNRSAQMQGSRMTHVFLFEIRALQEQAITTLAPEPWFVTKISHSTDLAEFRGSFGKEGR